MSSCVNLLRFKCKDQGFNLSLCFFFKNCYHSFFHLRWLFSLWKKWSNKKEICIKLWICKWFYERKFFWGNYSTKMFKQLKFTNSLHYSQTRIEVQQENKENEERWNKKEKHIRCNLEFTFIRQCGFHQNNNILL
jgi:hypothetical protein